MMFYDLNVPWSAQPFEVQRILQVLKQQGVSVVALNHSLTGKVPADISCKIPDPLPFTVPSGLRILRRCTLTLDDPSQNHKITSLSQNYDIFAIRPVTEKALAQACQIAETDIISFDMSIRYPFPFKMKSLTPAIARGVKFEINYSPGMGADNAVARRNLISNATALIRGTKGRGLIISSEAEKALWCRAPNDVMNLAVTWGLKTEIAKEAITTEPRATVVQASLRRTSYRGVVDVIDGGTKPEVKKVDEGQAKRKAETQTGEGAEGAGALPISKREMKRRAKKARLEAAGSTT